MTLALAMTGCATAPREAGPSGSLYSGTAAYRTSRLPEISGGSFSWPLRGDVIVPYGAKVDRIKSKGIDIKASVGANVVASRDGDVVFSSESLKGYGRTIILDHGGGFQTVYAYNSDLIARPGNRVRQNEVIARAGKTGRAKEACLHFEIRKSGRPVDPLAYLPD